MLALSHEAVARGIKVYLYLIDDGVENIKRGELATLSEKGVRIFVCAYGARRRGVPMSDQAVFCGLVVLSDMITGCDRFIAFN